MVPASRKQIPNMQDLVHMGVSVLWEFISLCFMVGFNEQLIIERVPLLDGFKLQYQEAVVTETIISGE